MEQFTYYAPTKVIFGKGKENEVGNEIKKSGGTRVFVVYGGQSARKSGLLDRVEKSLEEAGLEYKTLGGVKPNPRLSLARQGVKEAIDFKADFLLAVGGGSVIDTAKSIAHGIANPDTDIWDFWTKKAPLTRSTPVACILTISAAGSEMSDSAVLTNEETGQKRGLSTEFNRVKFAILNPELTFTLPRYQVGCGVVDIMMHTMDRYFTDLTGCQNDLTDEIAEALLRTVIKNGAKAMEDKTDYHAMSEIMWAGSLSHNGLTGLGAPMDFTPHRLGHSLSAIFDVAHGASLCTMWAHWARYVKHLDVARFARFARNVWGLDADDEETLADMGIDRTEEFFRSIDMPTCFTELGIGIQDEEGIKKLVDRCFYEPGQSFGKLLPMKEEYIYPIYMAANK